MLRIQSKNIGFRAGRQKLGNFNLMKYPGFIDENQTVHNHVRGMLVTALASGQACPGFARSCHMAPYNEFEIQQLTLIFEIG